MRGLQNRTMYNIPTGIISTSSPSNQSFFLTILILKKLLWFFIRKFLLLMILLIEFGAISTNRTENEKWETEKEKARRKSKWAEIERKKARKGRKKRERKKRQTLVNDWKWGNLSNSFPMGKERVSNSACRATIWRHVFLRILKSDNGDESFYWCCFL